MKRFKDNELYKMRYPNYLDWSKAIWITKPGDTILDKKTGETYKVTNVTTLPVEGSVPRITVE